MKITPNDQNKKEQQQLSPGVSFLMQQCMSTRFQKSLSQFESATLSPKSPLHELMQVGFVRQPEAVVLPNNPANLNTIPEASLNGELRRTHQKTVSPQSETESVASLQVQGKLSSQVGKDLPYQDFVREASQKYNVPVQLVNAVIKQESAFNPKAVSHCGAQGLMQLMPATGKAYGCQNAFDPKQNIMAGTSFLSDLLKKYKGDVELALAGYNAGPGNVAKYGNQVPPFKETQDYVVKVQKYYQQNLAASEKQQAQIAQVYQSHSSEKS